MTEIDVAQTLVVGHLWQSVAIAAVLAAVLIFGRRMRGATRYSLAGVAFLASLALPLAAFVQSRKAFGRRPVSALTSQGA